MSALDTWEWSSFDIQWHDVNKPIRTVAGWVKAPFGVRLNNNNEWTITHLPTGLAMYNIAGTWSDAEQAAEAADFLRTLYNGWHDIRYPLEPKEEMKALGERIRSEMITRFPDIFLYSSSFPQDAIQSITLNKELWA